MEIYTNHEVWTEMPHKTGSLQWSSQAETERIHSELNINHTEFLSIPYINKYRVIPNTNPT